MGRDHREGQTGNPQAVGRRVAIGVALCVCYVVGGFSGFAMPALDAQFHLSLFPFGIAVGALHRWGWRWWPAVFLCTAIVPLSHGVDAPAALGTAALLLAGVLATCAVLRQLRVAGDYGRPSTVAAFLVAATVGALFTSALLVGACVARGSLVGGHLFEPWVRWTVAAFLSTLLAAPIVLLARDGQLQMRRAGAAESITWLVCTVVLTVAALRMPSNYFGVPLFGLVLLAAVWAVVRLNVVCALAAGTIFTIGTLLSVTEGIGLLAQYPPPAALRLVWNAGLLLGLGMLALNAFIVMHERAERRYRVLFERSPEPVWLVDPADGRFLAVNEAAARTYGWSMREFTELSVHDVVVRPAHAGADGESSALELHRHRDGHLMRIESRSSLITLDDRTARLTFNVDVTEREQARERALLAGAVERQRLGREIHDGLGQELTGAAFLLDALATRVRHGEPVAARDIDEGAAFVRSAFESARRIAHGLAPLRDGIRLDAALHELVARLRLPPGRELDLQIDASARDVDLPTHVVDGLYRIAQEAVSNAMRHSCARRIVVGLESSGYATVLRVRDDGTGFDTSGRGSRGLGLRSLRERADEIGASIRVDSSRDAGTSIECEYVSVTAPAAHVGSPADPAPREAHAAPVEPHSVPANDVPLPAEAG
jgi:PAS domain S-box-containing protein